MTFGKADMVSFAWECGNKERKDSPRAIERAWQDYVLQSTARKPACTFEEFAGAYRRGLMAERSNLRFQDGLCR